MPLAHATPDYAHAGQHHFHRVRNDVLSGATLETVDADRRHAAVAAFVEADREIEIFGRLPEPLVIGVMDHLVVVRIRTREAAAKTEFLARKPHLLDRQINRLHRQDGDAK